MRTISIFATLFFSLSMILSSCQKDPCDGNLCANGGFCNDGTCDCPDGFGGPHCQDQVAPTTMKVTGVTLTRYPQANGDILWDESDGPDLFYKISEPNYPLAQPEYLIENAMTGEMTFIMQPFDIRYVSSTHKIELFDYDGIGIPSQKLGEIDFTPYTAGNGFPSSIMLDNGGPIAFRVAVTYDFTVYPD